MEYGLIFHVSVFWGGGGGNFLRIWRDIPRYAYLEILLKYRINKTYYKGQPEI